MLFSTETRLPAHIVQLSTLVREHIAPPVIMYIYKFCPHGLRRLASIVVTRRTGYSEGPNFSPNYAILLHKWPTRLLLIIINREIANAIFEGARNARGGERQFAAGRGLAESNLHLFEPVQLLL